MIGVLLLGAFMLALALAVLLAALLAAMLIGLGVAEVLCAAGRRARDCWHRRAWPADARRVYRQQHPRCWTRWTR